MFCSGSAEPRSTHQDASQQTSALVHVLVDQHDWSFVVESNLHGVQQQQEDHMSACNNIIVKSWFVQKELAFYLHISNCCMFKAEQLNVLCLM